MVFIEKQSLYRGQKSSGLYREVVSVQRSKAIANLRNFWDPTQWSLYRGQKSIAKELLGSNLVVFIERWSLYCNSKELLEPRVIVPGH